MSIGVAAHITAASPGGPRFDPNATKQTRSSIHNGLWLCQSCATMIDRDRARFHSVLLRQWKLGAEAEAAVDLNILPEYRAITPAEIRSEITRGEHLSLCALEHELGCRLAVSVLIPTVEGGWLRLDAAAVHGEVLVAVDIRSFDGRGVAYFQIEHFISLADQLRFPHFSGIELWVVIVSTAPVEAEPEVLARLTEIAQTASFPVINRLYRVTDLEALFVSKWQVT